MALGVLGGNKIKRSEVERLKSRIGVELRFNQFNEIATQENIRKFVMSIGDDNRMWLDPYYARNTVYGTIIAPPMFLNSVVVPSGALAGGLPGVHSFHGGADWQFFKPMRRNTKIKASARLTDVVEKEKSEMGGHSVIQTVEVSYKDQNDAMLAIAKGWSIRVEREEAIKRGKYSTMAAYKYTTEEINAIEDACVAEKPLGDTIRYWDDVKEGDELPPVIKGPLSIEDMEKYFAAAGGISCYATMINFLRKHPAFFYRDPNTNFPEPMTSVNLHDYAAQGAGVPRAFDSGGQRMSWLGHLMTNWMGDYGFLAKLNVKLIRPNLFGDTQWCKGKVARKYTEGEHFYVDCDIWCENQRGQQTAIGTATVRLLAKQIV